MDSFQIGQLVVVRIDADTEEEPCVASVYDFVVAELVTYPYKLFKRQSEIMENVIESYQQQSCTESGRASCDRPQRNWTDTSGPEGRSAGVLLLLFAPIQQKQHNLEYSLWLIDGRTFSSSSNGTYHFDRRVLPCRFYEVSPQGKQISTQLWT